MRAAVLFVLAGLLLAGCTSPREPMSDGPSGKGHDGTPEATDAMHDGHGAGMSPGMAHVTVLDGHYEPAQVDATTEGGVHFTNEGDGRHTVTIVDDGGSVVWDVELESGEATHFQPEGAGQYHAFCRFHDGAADIHVA